MAYLQGPLWRNIRGFGLAYHYNIILHPNEGVLYLTLFRSTDIVQAFRKTKDIVVCFTLISNNVLVVAIGCAD